MSYSECHDLKVLKFLWTFRRRNREKKKGKLVIVNMAERDPETKAVGDYSTPVLLGYRRALLLWYSSQ